MTITIDEKDVKERVAAGATMLDKVHPGWEHEVDPSAIRVASHHACPLGQMYGNWDEGLIRLEQAGVNVDDKGVALGFQSRVAHDSQTVVSSTDLLLRLDLHGSSWKEYGMLDAHWRNEVENRRRPLKRRKVLSLW